MAFFIICTLTRLIRMLLQAIVDFSFPKSANKQTINGSRSFTYPIDHRSSPKPVELLEIDVDCIQLSHVTTKTSKRRHDCPSFEYKEVAITYQNETPLVVSFEADYVCNFNGYSQRPSAYVTVTPSQKEKFLEIFTKINYLATWQGGFQRHGNPVLSIGEYMERFATFNGSYFSLHKSVTVKELELGKQVKENVTVLISCLYVSAAGISISKTLDPGLTRYRRAKREIHAQFLDTIQETPSHNVLLMNYF